MKSIWLATRNADMTEGRGPMVTIAAFECQDDARRAAQGYGVMGVGDGDVEALIVYDNFREWDLKKKDEVRNKALAKLTHDERVVLGLQ